ncbi:MAG: hypothetical protein NVS3B20_06880 [Polyangiales bacterium]
MLLGVLVASAPVLNVGCKKGDSSDSEKDKASNDDEPAKKKKKKINDDDVSRPKASDDNADDPPAKKRGNSAEPRAIPALSDDTEIVDPKPATGAKRANSLAAPVAPVAKPSVNAPPDAGAIRVPPPPLQQQPPTPPSPPGPRPRFGGG